VVVLRMQLALADTSAAWERAYERLPDRRHCLVALLDD
jgi:hypothetical protein